MFIFYKRENLSRVFTTAGLCLNQRFKTIPEVCFRIVRDFFKRRFDACGCTGSGYSFLFALLIVLAGFGEAFAQTPPSGFSSTTTSSGWNGAVGMAFNANGSKMFVWEKGGKVWVAENSQKQLVLDISEEVGNWHDHGMLGFALHPQFEQNGYFYLLYVVDRHHLFKFGTAAYNPAANEYYSATIGRLTRYTATKTAAGYSVDKSSRKILLGETKSTGIPILSVTHGVGTLLFGTDGTLLVSCGESASYTNADTGGGSISGSYAGQGLADGIITPQEDVGAFRSQLLETQSGKILRIDPITGNGIASNPFYEAARPGSARSKTYALGLRNPFRMALKPGTGSADRAAGNPGVLYVGDVGAANWEELNIVTGPGMNFGWPLFEGLDNTTTAAFRNANTYNRFAPNPLYGTDGCTQEYFYFRDLIRQATASGNATFSNPCNNAQAVPAGVKTFMHSRPAIDWKHQADIARTGIFNGETAAVAGIGAAGSPVTGTQFRGSASVGGVFYTGNDFPAGYKGTYFHGDYSAGWIKNIAVNASDRPVSVRNFIDNGAIVVAMASHPVTGGLYYVHYGSEVRKINYGANRPPVAIATADKTFGPGPLTVQFTGSNSTDPEGLALTYEWNFGDGSPVSTATDPSHTYKSASGLTTTRYTVVLKVKDGNGLTSTASVVISVNNTPPAVTITSPAANAAYSLAGQSTIYLKASVSDKEHGAAELSYQWQTTLHHNDHTHPGPVDTKPETTATLTPQGCDGETYFYRVTLTVTDAAGLATTREVNLYPDCNTLNKAPAVSITSPAGNASYTAPASIVITASAADADGTVSKVEFFSGSTKLGEDVTAPYSYSWNSAGPGSYSLTARATDNSGAVSVSAAVNVVVKQAGPAVVSFTLVDAGTQKDIGPLTDGYVIDFTALGTKQLNIRANTNPSTVGSVVFKLDGANVNTHSRAPYVIKGNNGNGKVYNPWTPSPGAHILTATPYTATNGSGNAGTHLTVRFTVAEKSKKSSKNARVDIYKEEEAGVTAIQAYPNPFVDELKIEFSLAESEEHAKVELYDFRGSLVAPLFEGSVEANDSRYLTFRTTSQRSGLYFIKLTTGKGVFYKKITLLR